MPTDTSYAKTLYVAMDIGKNVHWFGAYAGFELEPALPAFKLRSNQAGFTQSQCGTICQIVLRAQRSVQFSPDSTYLGTVPQYVQEEDSREGT